MTTQIKKADTSKESIWVSGILLDLNIFWWKGYIQLTATDIDKQQDEIPDIYRLGKKRMLKSDVFVPFQTLESQARVELNNSSYNFIVDKVRFIPYNQLDEVINMFNVIKEEFDLNRDLFVSSYEQNKSEFLNKYPDVAEKIIGNYPKIQDLYYKFDFSWKMLELSLPRDVSTIALSEQRKGFLVEQYAKGRENLNSQLDDWVLQVSRQMRKTIITTCENMQKTLLDGNIIRPSTLSKARETIERVKEMNFIGDEEIDNILTQFEKQLPGSLDRDVPSIMESFDNTMQQVVSQLSAADSYKVISSFGI